MSQSCDIISRTLQLLCQAEQKRVDKWFLRGEASPEQQMSSSEVELDFSYVNSDDCELVRL